MTQDADRAWAALRRLHEGGRATVGLLAQCSGKAESTIRRKIDKDGWKTPADRDAAGLKALRRFRGRLYLEMERLSASDEEFGKAEYDAINAMTRLIDKINDLTRSEEGATEQDEADDAFLAAAIEKIDRRISARRLAPTAASAAAAHEMVPPTPPAVPGGPPYALLVDLPLTPDAVTIEGQLRIALRARPWRAQLSFASPQSEGFERRASITAPATIGFLTASVGAGGVEGRIDHGTAITVRLLEGALASTTRAALMNGANTAAIRSGSGAWEIVQFELATETGPSVWSLANLLRGQLGTDDAMRAGLPLGAPFVLLNEALRPVGLRVGEVGLSLNWRFGPAGYDFSSAYYAQQTAAGGMRAQLPLSPVHLRADPLASGDLHLSWIRRSRVDADSWMAEDVPLGEAYERYRIDILDTDGTVRRTASATGPGWTYGQAQMIADFGTATPVFDVRLCQLSASVGAGTTRQSRIDLT